MFSYYGAKTNIVKHYPAPICDKIIEPFAGSARYSLLHFEKDVTIVDKYEAVARIWKHLQKCSPADILRLPRVGPGTNLDEINFDCIEDRWLMGFIAGYGRFSPDKMASPALAQRPNRIEYTLNRIAGDLYKIRHWTIIHGCYTDIENQRATWFVDAPYQRGGHKYKHSSKLIDFAALGQWCLSRNGQVIACESYGATWLPFRPLVSVRGAQGQQLEAVYVREGVV